MAVNDSVNGFALSPISAKCIMKALLRRAQGFTLIELMIVVAIISILAAIAMPQFANYRMRAFNTAAESDVRNLKSAEELLMTDGQVYGSSDIGILPGIGGAHGKGVELFGPKSGGTLAVSGAVLSGMGQKGEPHAVGFGISNGVYLRADTMVNDASFNIYARHAQGNRAFASEAETTAVLVCENDTWVARAGIMASTVAVQVAVQDLYGQPCGGYGNWSNWLIL